MNKKVLQIARKKFKELAKQYDQFNTVFLDNWRGYRFVYDTDEVKKYRGLSFFKSRLYALLKNEKPGLFSADLYPASREEKRLYGPNPFLNCKTYRQYRDCYAFFLLKKVHIKKEIVAELSLVKNLKVIYARTGGEKALEKKFRRAVISRVMASASEGKRMIIQNYAEKNKKFF